MAGTKTPISPGIIASVIAGVRSVFTSANVQSQMTKPFAEGPMAPGQPMLPVMRQDDGEQLEARRWDFPVGWNLTNQPRRESTSTRPHMWTADDLRLFSRSYGLLRIAIESRKSQIQGQDWVVRGRKGYGIVDGDPRLVKAQTLMNKPDGRHLFMDWQKTLLEDLFVLDQVCVRVDMTVGGVPIAFRQVDAGTIKMFEQNDGETPLAPWPAYAQLIKGMPSAWFTVDELIVRSYNPAIDWPYGYSPVEQIADIVSVGIQRYQHQMNYYTEGSMPESLVVGPPGMDSKQIAKMQAYWDMLYEGPNALQLKRKTRFLPNGTSMLQAKEVVLKDDMDDWLARQICYAFNISPTALVKETNRSTSETIGLAAKQEGTAPLMNWLKSFYDDVLARAGFPEMEFSWSTEDSLDPISKAAIDQIYVNTSVKTINEIRDDLGLEPVPWGDVPSGPTGTPPTGTSPEVGGHGPVTATVPQTSAAAGFMSIFGKRDTRDHGYGKPVAPHTHDHRPLKKKSGKPVKTTGSYPKGHAIDRERPKIAQQRALLMTTVQTAMKRWHAEAMALAEHMKKKFSDGTTLQKVDDNNGQPDFGGLVTPGSFAFSVKEQDAIIAALTAIAQDGALGAVGQLLNMGIGTLGADVVSQAPIYAAAYARQLGGEMITGISETTRRSIADMVGDAIDDGWSNDELASNLSDAYDFSDARANTIARTDTAYADARGNMSTYQSAGVESKEWAVGSNSCELCYGNLDDGVIPLGDAFSSGDTEAPAHPNCTCDVFPVLDNSSSDSSDDGDNQDD